MKPCILLAGGGTGGHVFPMIAVADALMQRRPDLRLVFLGTERGMERRLVPEAGYELSLMKVLPIRGGGVRGAAAGVLRAASSIPEARQLLKELAPRAVFSIGGYAAGPVCVAARSLGIGVALMEPNSVMGLANWLIARLAGRAYTAFPEAEKHCHEDIVLRAGVPIRAGFQPVPYERGEGAFRLLVLGGSQGAKAINEALPKVVQGLMARGHRLQILHQTGAGHGEGVSLQYEAHGCADQVTVREFLDEVPEALAWADLVLGRSGAGAVSEICAVGRASLLIPYPYAAGDHQRYNAESLVRAGAAKMLLQGEASAPRLVKEIDALLSKPEALSKLAQRAALWGKPNAAAVIADDLLELAKLGGAELQGASRGLDEEELAAASEPRSQLNTVKAIASFSAHGED